jgi:hypothetical protein
VAHVGTRAASHPRENKLDLEARRLLLARSMNRSLASSLFVLFTFVACGGQTDASAPDPAPADSSQGSSVDAAPTGCHSFDDCAGLSSSQGTFACFGPTSTCGGIEACTADNDCTSGTVCSSRPNGRISCRLPCAGDDDCAPTDACSTDGHCVARTCDDCPSYLTCSDGACLARDCSADSDCPGGYCVGGTCGDRLGACKPACE